MTSSWAAAVSSCDDEQGCVTCGDVAVEMRVLAVDDGRELALCVTPEGERETVEIALVQPVTRGDDLLVHAGTAIAQLEDEPGGNPAAPGRGSTMEEPEAEAEGNVFRAGAEEAAGIGAGAEQPAG